jgi:hypothetical protein
VRRLALIVAALALASCGDNGDSGDTNGPGTPNEAAEAYIAAQKEGDTARECDLYSDAYLEVIETEGGSCEEAPTRDADEWREEDRKLVDVEEVGDGRAIATVSCEDSTAPDCSLPLIEEDGGWKVDSGLHPNDEEAVDFTTE